MKPSKLLFYCILGAGTLTANDSTARLMLNLKYWSWNESKYCSHEGTIHAKERHDITLWAPSGRILDHRINAAASGLPVMCAGDLNPRNFPAMDGRNRIILNNAGTKALAFGYYKSALLLEMPSANKIATLGGIFSGHSDDIKVAIFSLDDKTIYTGAGDAIYLWSNSGENIGKIPIPAEQISLTSEGHLLVSSSHIAHRLSADGKIITKWQVSNRGVYSLKGPFEDPETKNIVAFADDGVYSLLPNGKTEEITMIPLKIGGVCLRNESNQLLVSKHAQAYDLKTGVWISTSSSDCIPGQRGGNISKTAVTEINGYLTIKDPSGKEISRSLPKEGYLTNWEYFADSSILAITHRSGVSIFYDYPSLRKIATIAFAKNDEFIIAHEDGRYDFKGDASSMAHWVSGTQILDMKSFEAKYFTPGLLTEIVTGKALPSTKKQPALAPLDHIAKHLIGKVWQVKPGGEIEVYISGGHAHKPGSILRVLSGKTFIPLKIKQSFHTKVICSGSGAIAKGMPVFR